MKKKEIWYYVCNDYSLEKRATKPDLTGYENGPWLNGLGWWEIETGELHYYSETIPEGV